MKYEEFMEEVAPAPKRGEVYYTELPKIGRFVENGRRPVLIVSNDVGNVQSEIVLVVPLTSQKKKELPTHVELKIKGIHNTVLCEQFMTVNQDKLEERLTGLCGEDMEKVEQGMRNSLNLNKVVERTPVKSDLIKEKRAIVDNQLEQSDYVFADGLNPVYDAAADYTISLQEGMKWLKRAMERCQEAKSDFNLSIGGKDASVVLNPEVMENIREIATMELQNDVEKKQKMVIGIMDQTFTKEDVGKETQNVPNPVENISKTEENVVKTEESVVKTEESVVKTPKTKKKAAVQEKTKAVPTAKKIDIDKAMALKEAGWNNQQIAEEFGSTKNAVAVAICNERKRRKQLD